LPSGSTERSLRAPTSSPRWPRFLGSSVEELLGISPIADRKPDPVGKTQKIFEEVAKLPRSQQDKIIDIVSALLDQYKRKAS